MSDRLIKNFKTKITVEKSIDYVRIRAKLRDQIQISKDYIERVLEYEEKNPICH